MDLRRAIVLSGKNVTKSLKPQSAHSRNSLRRSMATEAPLPASTMAQAYTDAHLTTASTEPVLKDTFSLTTPSLNNKPGASTSFGAFQNPFLTSAQCVLYSFPALEPTRFVSYPSTHLLLPLRRDILHKAVIYEGDMTRSGTASTKHRSEVHGSGRKMRPQKGSGRSRIGDKKSPVIRGGGVAFGPKPRDFSTELPKKIYDLAWRTALSYRYATGNLILIDGKANVKVHEDSAERYMRDMMVHNHIGERDGRTLFVTKNERTPLIHALKGLSSHGRTLPVWDVDVKDLLERGRVVIEKEALDRIFHEHQSDLGPQYRLHNWLESMQDKGVSLNAT